MGKLIWRGYIPKDEAEGAIEFLNKLQWNLSSRYERQEWRLWAGDQLLFIASTRKELDAFLCGMAISLAVLPDNLIDQIKKMAAESSGAIE